MNGVDVSLPAGDALLRAGLPLGGRLVRLEPLDESHVGELADAAAESRASYGYTLVPEGREAMAAHVRELLAVAARGEELPFAQIRVVDGRAVGLTRFLTLRRRPGETLPYAVEIGGTWLAGSAQRSGINLEAKRLLLEHAFERWHVGRVDLKTDARNARSRAAILALGVRFEGVLRHWQPSLVPGEEELLRDSALYSILPTEWPEVRELLTARLSRAAPPAAPHEQRSLP
jgi:RimJ/RimL family protein N-acetyltransferase